jgi:hypothetical protein
LTRAARGVVAERVPGQSGSNAIPEHAFRVGSRVEVRDRFQGSWSRGFEIAGEIAGGYTLRRVSDRSILPVAFPAHELRSNDVGR